MKDYPKQFMYNSNDGKEAIGYFKMSKQFNGLLTIDYVIAPDMNQNPGEISGKLEDMLDLTLRDIIGDVEE